VVPNMAVVPGRHVSSRCVVEAVGAGIDTVVMTRTDQVSGFHAFWGYNSAPLLLNAQLVTSS
jgi:hypothetical protein